MSIYSLSEFKTGANKVKIFKLMKDYYCPFDDFEDEVKANHKNMIKSLKKIYHVIGVLSRGLQPNQLNYKFFSDYEGYHMFEIKHEKLRVYGIIDDNNYRIIILGGLKKTQDKDILKVKNLIKEYKDSKE